VLEGVHPSAVIEAIKARAARGRRDGRKLGLVVEGGAMRGVCSAGGLAALAHLGLSDVFDEVYATSAGAMNASYFLSGQASLGITVYYEEMIRDRVINPWRLWRVLDLDHVFDQIITRKKVLSVEAVQASGTRLLVSMMDARTAELLLVDTRASATPLMTVLKAGSALPIVYNRSVEVDGRLCIDAGIASPFPLHEALASDCTDLLVLLTRPRGFRRSPPSRTSDWLFKLYARGNQALLRAHAGQPERDAELRGLALGHLPVRSGINIATLCTADDEVVERMTIDPVRLHAAAVRCGRRMLGAMGADAEGWTLAGPTSAA
jgi:predicted patatin/cPLA2 family phospholipase